ncbi:hypothetical protein FRC03_008917 [Tulasnella sp. 419]|nr:hypothetical protein FRC03_008917 [Tulasnella sp. 419]
MDSSPWKTYAESEKTAIDSRPWTPVSGLEKQASVDDLAKHDFSNLDITQPIRIELPEVKTDADIIFPEGGRGWLVVAGCWFMIASSFGLVNSWVFQAHYQTTVLPTINPSTISWIGSIQYSFIFLPGLIVGRLFDLGYLHTQLIPACLSIVVSTILVAECKVYWQFMLCQGIVTGLGCGFCFGSCLPTISHWFKKKRATAFGIAATGSATGGTLIPIAVRNLIPRIGFQWTMRALGLILLFEFTMALILMRRRLPPSSTSGGLFDPQAFRSAPYTIYVVASCVAYLGLYTQLTYIDVSGVLSGVPPQFSFYLVSIANASSLIGRLSSGYLCDRFGNLNVLIPFNIVTALATFVWPFCRTQGSLIGVAICYGIPVGAFASLVGIPVASLGSTGDVGRRTGMLFTFCAFANLVGPPISGAIFSKHERFVEVGIYAGSMILGSAIVMLAARWYALGQWRGKF